MTQWNTETFKDRIKELNPNLEILSEYTRSQDPVRYKCLVCGCEREALAMHLLKGHGCSRCAKNMKRTTESFIEEMAEINPNITILGEYINARTHISCKCKVCGNEWNAVPYSLTIGRGCPECGYKKISESKYKTNEWFVSKLNDINPLIEPLEEYKSNDSKIKFRCKECQAEWYNTPNKVLQHRGCPHCKMSNPEREIKLFLERNSIDYIYEKSFDDLKGKKNGFMSYDFYLPDKNILIEYQGKQHYRPVAFGGIEYEKAIIRFIDQLKNDEIKNNYAKEHGYNLLIIPYWFNDKLIQILSGKILNKRIKEI